jgi:ElaB/YqjD/DUF883 family membrane-anchored ribosome-binding protein
MNSDAAVYGDIHDKAGEAGEKARSVAGKVKEAAQDTMTQIKESSAHAVEEGKKRAATLERTLEGMIKESPIKAVLIAAGAGLLVGVVWKLTS